MEYTGASKSKSILPGSNIKGESSSGGVSGIGGVVLGGPVTPGRCPGGTSFEGTGREVIPGTGDIDGADGMLTEGAKVMPAAVSAAAEGSVSEGVVTERGEEVAMFDLGDIEGMTEG